MGNGYARRVGALLAAGLLTGGLAAQGSIPPPAGLTGWWAFDGNAADFGPSALDGTLSGPGGFAAARVLQGYLPGGPGSLVTVPDAAPLDLRVNWTFEGWVRVDALRPAHSYLINKGSALHRTTPFAIGIVRSSGTFPATAGASITGVPAPGRVFAVVSDNSLEQAVISSTSVPLGTFVHIAVTVQQVATGTQLRIYQNGVQTGFAWLGRLPFNGTAPLQLAGVAGGLEETLNGILDEPTLYGRALAGSEIQAIFAAGAGGKTKPQFDTTPPVISIDVPLDGMVVGSALVAVRATVVDESPTTVASSPAGVTGSLPAGGGTASGDVALDGADGDYTIAVTATDTAGNAGGASVTVTRDTSLPIVAIPSPAEGAILGDAAVTLAIDVSDLTATSVVAGGAQRDLPAGGGAVLIPVTLVPGPNALRVVVTDRAGNRAELVRNVLLDLDAPVVTILAPADGALYGPGSSAAAVAVRVDDLTPTSVASDPAGLAATLPAGGGLASGLVPLVEGLNRITVTASDETQRATSSSITVNLDTTPPLLQIESPQAGAMLRDTVELRANAADVAPGSGIVTLQLLVDGQPIASQQSGDVAVTLDTTQLTDGAHSLVAIATDGAGNESRAMVGFAVDNTPPNVQVLTPVPLVEVQGMFRFEAQATDVGSGMRSLVQTVGGQAPMLDGSQFASQPRVDLLASGQEDAQRWPDGVLTLRVVATDFAGNTAQVEFDVLVSHPTMPPPALTPADGQQVRRVVELVANAAGPDLREIELAVDGQVVARGSSATLRVPLDTRRYLDGPLAITATVRTAHGETSTRHVLQVDNMQVVRLQPGTIDLKAKRGARCAWVDVTGPNLQLLLPLRERQLTLRVDGGSPVPVRAGWIICLDRHRIGLRLFFDRRDLANAIRAGLASGALAMDDLRVEVRLLAGDRELGAQTVRIHSHRHDKRR